MIKHNKAWIFLIILLATGCNPNSENNVPKNPQNEFTPTSIEKVLPTPNIDFMQFIENYPIEPYLGIPSWSPVYEEAVISVRGIRNNEYWTFVFIYKIQDNKVQRIYEYQALKGWDIADAIWSPDGRYFAFVPKDVAFGDDGQLWIINRDGSEKRQFRAQYIKEWSPDSKKIYFGIKDYCGFINVESWSKEDCE